MGTTRATQCQCVCIMVTWQRVTQSNHQHQVWVSCVYNSPLTSCYSRWLDYWSKNFIISRTRGVQKPIQLQESFLWLMFLPPRSATVLSSIMAALNWSALTATITRYKWTCSAQRFNVWLSSLHHHWLLLWVGAIQRIFCGMIISTSCILAILPELMLKAKPIWEPKNWVTDKDGFLWEMEELIAWGNAFIILIYTFHMSIYNILFM